MIFKEYLINLPHNVQTIITTRQPTLVVAEPHISIEEFSDMEAKLYLKNSLSNRAMSEELLNKLIENTGTLPYDVKCVAAYLIDNPSILVVI